MQPTAAVPSQDNDALVTVYEAIGEFEAQSIVVVLQDAGIPAHVFMLANLPLPPSIVGGPQRIPVQVAQIHAEAAGRVLAQLPGEADAIDWEKIDVGEMTDEVRAGTSFNPMRAFAVEWRVAWRLVAALIVIAAVVTSVAAVISQLRQVP